MTPLIVPGNSLVNTLRKDKTLSHKRSSNSIEHEQARDTRKSCPREHEEEHLETMTEIV